MESLSTSPRTVDRSTGRSATCAGAWCPRGRRTPRSATSSSTRRVETLAEKPSWRTAVRKRRAVVPAAGYYEWTPRDRDGKVRKQPYFIHPADDGVLAFAGLYEMWRDPTKADDDPDRWLWTIVIITTEATGAAGEIHDRTPLIRPPDRVDAWLDPNRTDPDQVYDVLDGIVMNPPEVRAVSTKVNRVGNDGGAPGPTSPADTRYPRCRPGGRLSLIHISEPTRRTPISYAVFCLKKKTYTTKT